MKDLVDMDAKTALTDSHCHVYPEEYGPDLDGVMERAFTAGVRRMLVVGSDVTTSASALRMAERYADRGVYAAVGVHPHEASSIRSSSRDYTAPPMELQDMLRSPRAVAIGETGLDYHYDHSPREQQRSCFRMHIRWARTAGKPLVIHGRESYNDLLHILREEDGASVPSVIHCFSGTGTDAEAFLEMGCFLSFAGPLTFKKNDGLRRVFLTIPEERLLLETDSPYLAPHPFRGMINEPSYIPHLYRIAAELRGKGTDDMAELVWNNASRLFGWNGEKQRTGRDSQ